LVRKGGDKVRIRKRSGKDKEYIIYLVINMKSQSREKD